MIELLDRQSSTTTGIVPAPERARGRRVVLVSYHYPPDHAVGGLRPARLARAFASAGYGVSVITAERAGDQRAELTQGHSIEVRPVRMQPSPRAALLLLRNELRGAAAHATADPAGDWAAVEHEPHASPLKRWLLSLLWLPDDLQGFIVPAARAVLREVAEGCDLVYTSGPPFSTHLAGWAARAIGGVPWVAEFRDPWTDNPGKPAFVRSALSDAAERWLEHRVLCRADGIVAVTPGTGRLLADKLPPGRRDRVTVALSGIDLVRSAPPVTSTGPIRILYTGNLYLGRDPRPFLEGLAEARQRLGLGVERVRVDFVGDCRVFRGTTVQSLADALGVGDLIHFTDWASPEECRRLQEGADVLLLLAEGQPLQVPNKLYEYLGTRRPILAFVDRAGESARMLTTVGEHLLVTDRNPATAADAIVRGLELARSGKSCGDEGVLRSWSSDTQMSALIDWAERIR